jgi:hypothetical protein
VGGSLSTGLLKQYPVVCVSVWEFIYQLVEIISCCEVSEYGW